MALLPATIYYMFGDYKDAEDFKGQCGYTIDSLWYPRVTKILSIKAKPALLYYYAEQKDFKTAQASTQKSAEEGTKVHEAAQAILLGKEPEVDPLIKPAIDAFRNFLTMKNVQTLPEYIERRIVHYSHRYAGTIDVMGLIDGRFGVLDIKTSQSIYRDYNLQTAAYMDALKSDFTLQTRWILRIDQNQICTKCGATLRTKGGREKIKGLYGRGMQWKTCAHEWSEVRGEIELKEFPYWEDDFEAFLGAKKLWEWENEYWLKKIGYLKSGKTFTPTPIP